MFDADVQLELRSNGFDLECEEENIWIKEKGDESVTLSGDKSIYSVIWQDFDGNFEEYSSNSLEEVLDWVTGCFCVRSGL